MPGDLARRLVTDKLWALTEPLLPPFTPRRQGGGTAPVDERRMLTAVVWVLTSGCPWRMLPPWLEVSPATAHRRFTAWTEAGVWRRLYRAAVRNGLAVPGDSGWAAAIVKAAGLQAGQAPRETSTKS
ncbi:transposase [Streptomyces sp. NPDC055506]